MRLGCILVLLLLLMPISGGIIYMNSAVDSIITIDEKWIKTSGLDMKYLLSDSDGNVYSIEDSIMLWKFDASDRWVKLKAGETYSVRTYGWRINWLSMYPNITKVK